jgi:transcriptional regulator with XRE-family HTH domain
MRTVSEVDRQALAVVGQAVRIARERAALSQRRLAARAQVSQSAISRMERGAVRGIGLVYFARVVDALGDAMPLVGCPHGHACDHDRQWRYARNQVSPDREPRRAVDAVEGATLYELIREIEREVQAGERDRLDVETPALDAHIGTPTLDAHIGTPTLAADIGTPTLAADGGTAALRADGET